MDRRVVRADHPVALSALVVLAAANVPKVAVAQTPEEAEAERAAKHRIEQYIDFDESRTLLDAVRLDAARQAAKDAEAWRETLDSERVVEFNIKDGSLLDAVRQVSVQGWRGSYYFDEKHGPTREEAETIQVKGFRGAVTVRQAIDRVLSGTGFVATFYKSTLGIRVYRPEGMSRDGVEQPILISFGGGRLEEEADYLFNRTGTRFPTGQCAGVQTSKPISGKFTALEAWTELLRPICIPARYTLREYIENNELLWYAALINLAGRREIDFDIEAKERKQVINDIARQTGLTIPYLSTTNEEEEEIIGPIRGRMSIHRAIYDVTRDSILYPRWIDNTMVSIEPLPFYPDNICEDESLCSLVRTPPETGHMLVSARRWPSFADVTSPTVIGRENKDEGGGRNIESTGKDNVADVLQQLSQTAFHPGVGYRASGTQCAVLRGVAPVRILINGRPTFGSAADFFEDCVDLNAFPLSAIDSIEVSPDAASLAHGADAPGGTVNLILKESAEQIADARYQGSRGGADVLHTSIVAGTSDGTWNASLVLDYSATGALKGVERERWRNQDFRRFGGRDYSSLLSAPPNVRSLNGSNLPGLDSTIAAVRVSPTGSIDFAPGAQNRSSLFAWQDIVPEIRRMSISAIANRELGSALLHSEFLVADRSVTFQYGPEPIFGVLGEHHPQNPFGVPVDVQAALIGLPLPEQEVHSTLLRGVLQVEGSWSAIDYSVYALHSTDNAAITSRHMLNYAALAEGLSGITASPLNLMTALPGEGSEYILSPASVVRSVTGGTIFAASAQGNVAQLPGGHASVQIGTEGRREFADYGNITAKLDRDVVSAFSILQLPIIEGLKATAGARVDHFKQLTSVTSSQYSIEWQLLRRLRVSAGYNDTFSAPRLFDLFFPMQSFPATIYDPAWQQSVPVTIIAGGNEHLRPAVGRSSTLGLQYTAPGDVFSASIDFWNVILRDRIARVIPETLLLHEDSALVGRIVRDQVTPDDVAANRSGRLRMLDVRRANFGRTETRGIDLSIGSTFRTEFGRFSPRIDVTFTDDFRYSDLPTIADSGRQRVGAADIEGTITKWQLRGGLSYAHRAWNVNILARRNSCYLDYDSALGLKTGRHVCPGVTVDFNFAKEIGEHIKLTIGASDVLDRSPSFSEAFGQAGYDLFQDDLVGRSVFASISGRIR